MGCKEIPLIFFSLFSLSLFLILFCWAVFFVMFDSTLFSFQRDNQRIRWRGVSGASIKVWRYCRQILRQNEATEDWRWDNHFRSHQLPSAMLVGTVEESGTFGSISSKLSSVILKGGKFFLENIGHFENMTEVNLCVRPCEGLITSPMCERSVAVSAWRRSITPAKIRLRPKHWQSADNQCQTLLVCLTDSRTTSQIILGIIAFH